jgi:hypothetical protein
MREHDEMPGMEEAIRLLLALEHHGVFVRAMLDGIKDPDYGARLLFYGDIKQRCAAIALEDEPLFRGVLVPGVGAILRQKTFDWERDIQALLTHLRSQKRPRQLPQCGTDLLAKEFAPLHYFADGLFLEGLTLLAGKPKRGKSYLSLQMCLDISLGRSVFRKIPSTKTKVLYISLEDGPRRIQSRLRQMQSNIDTLDNLHFLYAFPSLGEGAYEDICHYVEECGYGIVVIDVLGRILPSGRQRRAQTNEYLEITELLGPIQRYANERRIGILIIDHVRKAGADDIFDTVMGTQGKIGVADTVWVYERREDDNDGCLHMRGRDIDEQSLVIARVDGHMEFVGDGDTYTQDAQRLRIINAIQEVQAIEGRAVTTKEIMLAIESPPDHYHRVRQMLYRMHNDELIGRTPKGNWTVGHSRCPGDEDSESF